MPAVLVVVGSPKTRELLGMALRLDGHAVLVAVDNAAAWRTLETEPVTAAVIDLELTGPGGLALVSRIRADEHLRGLPVVVVGQDAEKAALEAGADRAVQGVLTIGGIREAVEGAVAERFGDPLGPVA